MERETKTLKTTNGHEIIYKAWLTGREKREIQNIFLDNVDIEGGKPNKIKGSLAMKAQDKTLEVTIVSIDGKEENIVDMALDLPSIDFDEVIEVLNDEPAKKK